MAKLGISTDRPKWPYGTRRSHWCYLVRANAPRLRHGCNTTDLFLSVQSQRLTFLVLTPKYHHGANFHGPSKPFPRLKTLANEHRASGLIEPLCLHFHVHHSIGYRTIMCAVLIVQWLVDLPVMRAGGFGIPIWILTVQSSATIDKSISPKCLLYDA